MIHTQCAHDPSQTNSQTQRLLPSRREPFGLLTEGELQVPSLASRLWSKLKELRQTKSKNNLAEALALVRSIRSLGYDVILFDKGRIVEVSNKIFKGKDWSPNELDFITTIQTKVAERNFAQYVRIVEQIHSLHPLTQRQLLAELRAASRKRSR